MKNKILSLLILTIIVILSYITNVFASFADFTDEQADKQAQEQINEQQEKHKETELKSSDNYLSSLQIEGYTLTPEFDKQTLEYTIKEEIKSNEINIKATPSNEKATISGNGTIKIEEGKKEYRIDVTAESGTVRTYIIKLESSKLKESQEVNTQLEQNNTTKEVTIQKVEENTEKKSNNEEKSSNIVIYVIIGAIIIIVGILVLNLLKNSKKSKH